ncbi:MAG: DUF2188 domain-containing protein [Candidatus Izemoplasmatales bacterium]|nr:DUF2188 domain-containing protein [Hujiaoplasma nucleasis]
MFNNIFLENLTFIIIGLVFILVAVAVYIIFLKSKSYSNKESHTNPPESISKAQNSNIIEEKNVIESKISANEVEKKVHPVINETLERSMTADELLQQIENEKNKSNDIEEDENSDDTQDLDELAKETDIIEDKEDNVQESKAIKEENEDHEDELKDVKKEDESVELGKYHILYRERDDKWYVKRENSDKVIRVLHTKKEAIAYATIKAINQDTNIVIHSKDGKIEKHGY